MVLPRSSTLGNVFRASTRWAGARATSQTWWVAGRRSYASGHGAQKKSSDLPWLIGAIVFTVPSAAWLLQQGPTKSEHGHGSHDTHVHEEKAEGGEDESKEEGSEAKEDGDEGEEKPKEGDHKEGGESKSEDKSKAKPEEGENKSEDSDSDGGDRKATPVSSDDEEAPEE